MELRVVETFLKVVELGSFSQAADRLGYSQSAVTMQIKQLEDELGVRLLDRIPRGAMPTERGREFVFHARELLRAAEAAKDSVRDPLGTDGLRGTLRIGSAESISTAILPDILVEFHAEHPEVELVLETARKERLIEGLRENALDIFLTMERQISVRGLKRTLLREEPIVFTAAPALVGKLACGTRLSISDIPELPLVLTERGESYRHELECLLAEHDRDLRPIVEAGNTETLVHLAERGAGVAFLPRFSLAEPLRNESLVELDVPLPPLHMWSQMFTHASKRPTPEVAAFEQLIMKHFGCQAS